MGEYSPGASVRDMPQTVEQVGKAAETATMLPGMMGAASVPGISLASGYRRKLPPVTEVYHGTGSPAEYIRPNLPPPTHDLGIHTSVNPNISTMYAFKHGEDVNIADTVDFMSGKKFNAPDAAEPRVKPFLMDARKSLVYPEDAVKWNEPARVIEPLQEAMRVGFVAPRGLLSDMRNISASDKMWQDQFVPMLQNRGYDSLLYPHFDMGTGTSNYNSFMSFDPKQLTPKYSPEGSQLIKDRGVNKAIKKVSDFNDEEGKFSNIENWTPPKGILKKESEVESLVRVPSKNTFNWWENPKSPLSKIEAELARKSEEANKKFAEYHKNEIEKLGGSYDPTKPIGGALAGDAPLKSLNFEQRKLKFLLDDGKITKAEYNDKFSHFEDLKDQYYGNLVHDSLIKGK
jgi:hypothetical protein